MNFEVKRLLFAEWITSNDDMNASDKEGKEDEFAGMLCGSF